MFLSVDFSGALFSLLSLLVEKHFDVLAGVMYCLCMGLEIGIFGCHWVWLLKRRLRGENNKGDEESVSPVPETMGEGDGRESEGVVVGGIIIAGEGEEQEKEKTSE